MSGKIKVFSTRGKKVQKRKRKSGLKTAFIILLILVIGVAAFTVSLGFYVDRLDTIYPNVWADGYGLSGLTREEAYRALQDIGYENNADGVSVTVSFPDGSGFSITGNEAGFSLNAGEAANAAYEYGRNGTFFENELNYIRSYFRQTSLRDVSKAGFDNEYVRGVVRESTKKFNASLIDEACNVSATSIIITKGAGIEKADEDDVYDLTVSTLFRAMEERAHLTAEFIPNVTGASEIDLDFLYDTITVEPTPAYYDPLTQEISEGTEGVSFDIASARDKLDRAGIGTQIIIPLIRLKPDVIAQDIESVFFRDVLYTSTTKIAGTSNRLRNITIAAMAINGKELKPGEVFSFNETVGKRTADKGYTEAAAYVSGETVLEIGGGICQVSSTIYDCVLHADLEVVERRNHVFTVAYLPLGNDATVNWGTIDFRFKNNTDYPIRIDTEVDGRDLTITLYGTKLDENYIEIKYTEISSSDFKLVEREDESVPQGQSIVKQDGHRGHVVETYKYVYDADGNLLREEKVGRSAYSSQDRVILIPIKPEETDTDDTDLPDDGQTDDNGETLDVPPETSPSDDQSGTPSETPGEGETSETPAEETPGEGQGGTDTDPGEAAAETSPDVPPEQGEDPGDEARPSAQPQIPPVDPAPSDLPPSDPPHDN